MVEPLQVELVMVEMADLEVEVMVVGEHVEEVVTHLLQVQPKDNQVEMLMMHLFQVLDMLEVAVVELELLVVMEQDLLESEVLVVVECQIQF